MAFRKSPWEKEWADLERKEKKYTAKRKDGPTSLLMMKLERVIPDKLNDTLYGAFYKAFQLIFEKGTGVIEKTYNREKREAAYKINEYTYDIRQNNSSAKVFTKEARSAKTVNMVMTTVEGIGFGIVGAGLPDIPVFLGMVLKCIYEIAVSYGYDYESEEERIFILKLIEVAMCDEEDFIHGNEEVDAAIDFIATSGDVIHGWNITKDEQIRATSASMAREMIYTKFIQGLTVFGVFGGLFNPVYLDRITDYAVLKYRRRFLTAKMSQENYGEE